MGPPIMELANQAQTSKGSRSQGSLYYKPGHGNKAMLEMDPGRKQLMEANMGKEIQNVNVYRREIENAGNNKGINNMEPRN